MSENQSSEFNIMSIDQLLEKKKLILKEIRSHNDALIDLSQIKRKIDQELVKKKLPESNSRADKIAAFAANINITSSKQAHTKAKEKDILSEYDAEEKKNQQKKFVIADPHVTDHAIVRYLERVLNYDIDAVKNKILSKENILALKLGATSINVGEYKMICNNGKVITLYES